jgi:hypothetical protein
MRDWRDDIADLVDSFDVSTPYEMRTGMVTVACRHSVHSMGLYQQLRAALGELPGSAGGEHVHSGKPGSRPPTGWRADVSQLLVDIDGRTREHVRSAREGGTLAETVLGLRWLAKTSEPAPDLVEDIREWRRLARLSLGYQVPSASLPDVTCGQRRYVAGGWVTIGCKERSLRVAVDVGSAVWCANPGCHDSASHPDCTQRPPDYWSCRRNERDLRHAISWPAEMWPSMLRGTA